MIPMKSRKLKVRNLPEMPKQNMINLKPTVILIIMLFIGIAATVLKLYLTAVGLVIIAISIFCIIVMPDRTLAAWNRDNLVLFNNHDRSECMMISWEDIVSWHYERHRGADLLVLSLTDGSSTSQEMYSSLRIRRVMEQYAPGKEKKVSGIRRSL